MKRAIIITSFLIVLGIAIIGGALYLRGRRANVSEPTTSSPIPSPQSLVPASTPNRSLAECATVTDVLQRYFCFNNVLRTSTDESVCDGIGAGARGECLAVVISNEARAANDASVCDRIENEGHRGLCTGGDEDFNRPAPAEDDADADGLSDADEKKRGTSPFLPDTDGDGFKDGDEVNNGYDPLGPGRL